MMALLGTVPFFRELVGAVLLLITCIFIRSKLSNRRFPPGPKGWPIVGALPLLGTLPHAVLADMAKKYGPVMYLKMGTRGMVVASTPAAARTFLKDHDTSFRNRPHHAGAIHMAYNVADLVFADYGPKWSLLRKLGSLHMLGPKAVEDWAHVRTVEVGHMLRAMYESSCEGHPVVVSEMLNVAMSDMIGQVILSKRVFVTKGSESNEFKEMVAELMEIVGLFNIGDFIPSIAWMDLQGIERVMKRLHKQFDYLLVRMIKEHEASAQERLGKPDFLDLLMAEHRRENPAEAEKLTMNNIKALVMDLFTAGTHPSSATIEWALTEMIINPAILKKAQEEMDRAVGRSRRFEHTDITKLPYLQAVIKETFRKHPATPLNIPRISTEACEVDGYHIPKNTRLLVNIWGIGRDPNIWENPLEFIPERFLTGKTANIDPRGTDFELFTFGAGRRSCAGQNMATALVEYILGTLVQSFEWKLPDGVVLDMDERYGSALQKAKSLSAMMTPRLPPSAYTAAAA